MSVFRCCDDLRREAVAAQTARNAWWNYPALPGLFNALPAYVTKIGGPLDNVTTTPSTNAPSSPAADSGEALTDTRAFRASWDAGVRCVVMQGGRTVVKDGVVLD